MKSALREIPIEIAKLLESHTNSLEAAWANIGSEDALNISFSAKIGFDKTTKKPICEVGISFVVEKVKDSNTFPWDDHQMKLAGVK